MYHGPAKYPALTGLKRDVCLCEDAEWRNDSACTEWEAWCPDTSILCYIDLIPLGRPVFWLGCLSTVLWEREPGYLRKCGYFLHSWKWWKKPKVVITFENWGKKSLINPKRKGCERGQEIKRKTSQHVTYKLSHRLEFDSRTVCRLSLFSETAV